MSIAKNAGWAEGIRGEAAEGSEALLRTISTAGNPDDCAIHQARYTVQSVPGHQCTGRWRCPVAAHR